MDGIAEQDSGNDEEMILPNKQCYAHSLCKAGAFHRCCCE